MKYLLIPTVFALLTSLVNANTFEELIVFPGDPVNNKSLTSYADMWWQWTYTMPKNLNPVRDLTGKYCHIGQRGNVWFLAGGYGSSIIKRTCEIPEGKYIFFPVINNMHINTKVSCEDVKKSAAVNNDNLISIEIEINSLKASNPAHTRLASEECFDLLGLIPRTFNPPKWYPAASDGYWIMLKPLSKGTHKLKFKAAYGSIKGPFSKMVQDIEYDIIIK